MKLAIYRALYGFAFRHKAGPRILLFLRKRLADASLSFALDELINEFRAATNDVPKFDCLAGEGPWLEPNAADIHAELHCDVPDDWSPPTGGMAA